MRLNLTFCLLFLILYNRPTLQQVVLDDSDIGFVGNFAGISTYNSPLQFETLVSNHSLIRYSNDSIYEQMSTFNGNITCSCTIQDDIYFGGYFNSVNDTMTANHIIKYNMQTNMFESLLDGLDGPVYTMYCDAQNLYVGGNFSHHATQWNFNTHNWTQLPWKGFNGPVHTITKDPLRNTILFGGRFDATMDGQFFNSNTSQLVPLIAPTSISSGNGDSTAQNDPNNIICPGSAPWYLQAGVPGYWDANFANPIQPTVFRLTNTKQLDRGTISFNILALGSNEYYSLSYIDPATQQTIYCSTECILSNTADYQDFTVIENKASTKGIRININSWYGSGGGLGLVQIFQSDLSVNPYLNSNSNNTSCPSSAASSSTTQTAITGDWKEVYVYGYYRNVLEAQVPFSDLTTSNLSIIYQPYIPVQGQYEIYATTPGCVGSSNCFQRTQIQYDIQVAPNIMSTVVLDQNTFSDRRTLIYRGFVSPVSSTFNPSITLRPATNATINDSKNIVSVMAETLEFVRNSNVSALVSILEYNVSAPVVLNNNDSSLNAWKPLNQQLAVGSIVYTLDVDGDMVYIGGEFAANNTNTGLFRNIVSYNHSTGQFVSLNQTHLNGKVSKVLVHNSVLYTAGEFIATTMDNTTLNNVAQFDTRQRVWSGLENGLDGPATQIFVNNDTTTLTMAGAFHHRISPLSQQLSIGNALYDTITKSWIERPSLLVGDIVYSTEHGPSRFIAGALQGAQTHRANVMTTYHSFDVLSDELVTAGVTWTDNNVSRAIVAGYTPSFNTTHVYMQESNGWRMLGTLQGQVYSLATFDNRLYVGGHYAHTQSPSLTVYDLLSGVEVEGISGAFSKGGSPGTVHVIKRHPDGKHVLIGGQFSRVGSLDCDGVCVLDPEVRQWNPLVMGVTGTVLDMVVDANQITMVGELNIQTEIAKMAHVVGSDVQMSSNMDTIPGTPVTIANGALDDEEDIWILAGPLSNNEGFFVGSSRNSDGYTSLVANLGTTTEIHQLLLVPVMSSNNNEKRYPNRSQNMLLAVGHLSMTDYGNASAAVFDGEKWHPYLLTTQLNGQPGMIYQVVHPTNYNGMRPARSYLSVAAVILISIAISTGILFAMSALGLLYMYKHHHKHSVGPEPMPAWSAKQHRLIDTYGLFGAGVPANAEAGPSTRQIDQEVDLGMSPTTTLVSNPLPILTATVAAAPAAAAGSKTITTPFDASVALSKANQSDNISEAQPKLFYAKYEFKAQACDELSLQVGDKIVVTDTTDNVWWLGYKDGGGGEPVSGVFPSNFVSA